LQTRGSRRGGSILRSGKRKLLRSSALRRTQAGRISLKRVETRAIVKRKAGTTGAALLPAIGGARRKRKVLPFRASGRRKCCLHFPCAPPRRTLDDRKRDCIRVCSPWRISPAGIRDLGLGPISGRRETPSALA
jgi:hypothetical protein